MAGKMFPDIKNIRNTKIRTEDRNEYQYYKILVTDSNDRYGSVALVLVVFRVLLLLVLIVLQLSSITKTRANQLGRSNMDML